jgi:hypothetical protein
MEQIFHHIVSSFQSLWKMKDYGTSIEIITPQATTNDNFVSVFITKRGNDFVVTDGGWIEGGMYDCEPDHNNMAYQRLFNYYTSSRGVQVTEARGQKFYFKRITDEQLIPNLVFDMTQFINAVVSAIDVPFVPEKDMNTFRRNARTFLSRKFGDGNMEFDRPIAPELQVKFSAIKRDADGAKLINFVSGSTPTYYASSLCKSNMGFQMLANKRDALRIKKTVTLLDDRKHSLLEAPAVKPYYDYLRESRDMDNEVVMWSHQQQLLDAVS